MNCYEYPQQVNIYNNELLLISTTGKYFPEKTFPEKTEVFPSEGLAVVFPAHN
jgi:hypothetical protein